MSILISHYQSMSFLLRSALLAVVVGAWGLTACGRSPVAYGELNSIVVLAPDPLWEQVGDTIGAVLEPRIFTTREERTFDLHFVSPSEKAWGTFRMWRHVLTIGEADDPWVQPVLDAADAVPTTLPAMVDVESVWARGQRVTAVVLPPGGGPAEVLSIIPEVHEYLDGRFRDYIRQRMFTSGPNLELKQALETNAGFSLIVPNVYEYAAVSDSLYVFKNTQRRLHDLIRWVTVTWRSDLPPAEDPADWVLAWRDQLSTVHYDPYQVASREQIEVNELPGGIGLEVRGIWNTMPGDWPGAGPFVERVVVCPSQNRTYLVDAWLYAPGQAKYEYVLQLEAILETFGCGA